MDRRQPLQKLPIALVYGVFFVPAIWLAVQAAYDTLGADPVRELESTLGIWALRFLILSLCVTPLRRFTGLNLLRYRRALGLTAFWYVAMHLSVWLLLDRQLETAAIVADIIRRPYITVGMAGFALLVPLALTSNGVAIRRLGGKAWARLHKLAYVAVTLAAVHFVMAVKAWPPEPLIYAALVAIVLLSRLAYPQRRPKLGAAAV